MRKPFWRAQTAYWYCEIDGKQRRLSKLGHRDLDGGGRKDPPPAVQTEWHRLMREGVPGDVRVGDLVDAFLSSLTEGDNKTTTRRQLARFERHVGPEFKVSLLRPIKITDYLR